MMFRPVFMMMPTSAAFFCHGDSPFAFLSTTYYPNNTKSTTLNQRSAEICLQQSSTKQPLAGSAGSCFTANGTDLPKESSGKESFPAIDNTAPKQVFNRQT